MKKRVLIGIIIVLTLVIVIFSTQVLANSKDKTIDEETKTIENISNETLIKALEIYGIDYNKVEKSVRVETVEDTLLNRIVERANIANLQIDFENNNIVQIINKDDFKIVDESNVNYKDEKLEKIDYEIKNESQIENIISKIEEVYNLMDYKIVLCHNDLEGIWGVTWNKILFDDVLNPYDAVTISIDAKDGSIMTFMRKTVEPENINVELTKDEAFEIAKKLFKDIPDISDSEILLTVFRPNYYWDEEIKEEADFLRIAWKIIVDKKTTIMVDAENGEILGGDQTMSDGARAMALVPNTYGSSWKAIDMADAFSRLGYYEPYACQPHCGWVEKTDVMWVITHPQLYGLYINAHGLGDENGVYKNAIGDLVNWELYATEVSGNWHFVYLDCCYTSSTLNFGNAFNITGYSNRAFVGHNNEVGIVTSYQFTWRFAGLLGYGSTVLNCLLTARDTAIISGYTDCNPGFIGDSTYTGASW